MIAIMDYCKFALVFFPAFNLHFVNMNPYQLTISDKTPQIVTILTALVNLTRYFTFVEISQDTTCINWALFFMMSG